MGGGIAYISANTSQFRSFCNTNPKERDYVCHISELKARLFDDIILDDNFFNNSKTDSDVAATGDKNWSQFRLALMDQVAQNLVIDAARSVNPRVKVTIRFPNWYEYFQGTGYELDSEPKIFNSLYTATETRDPVVQRWKSESGIAFAIAR